MQNYINIFILYRFKCTFADYLTFYIISNAICHCFLLLRPIARASHRAVGLRCIFLFVLVSELFFKYFLQNRLVAIGKNLTVYCVPVYFLGLCGMTGEWMMMQETEGKSEYLCRSAVRGRKGDLNFRVRKYFFLRAESSFST